MKRDMDLIREILLFSEENCHGGQSTRVNSDTLENSKTDEMLYDHIKKCESGNLLKMVQQGSGGYLFLGNLTWEGHDFLDSVRDPKIWAQTKDVAAKAGGFSIGILGDIAKGLIKTQISKHTGVEL